MTDRCTAILVDGSNNYASLKALGYQMDFDKLLKLDYFGEVYRPYYFTALPPKEEHSALRPMVDHLQYHGWTVITKETKTWDNGADGIKTKGDMDGELFLTAVDIAHLPNCPVTDVALFSGDGDFRCLVEWLQRNGIRVTVFSTIKTQQFMCADELRRQADVFVDLADLRVSSARLADATPTRRNGFLAKGKAA